MHLDGGAIFSGSTGLSFNLEGRYNRSLASPGQANDRKPIFDVKINQAFGNVHKEVDLEMFIAVHNITNSTYLVDPLFPSAGRYVEGGVTFIF